MRLFSPQPFCRIIQVTIGRSIISQHKRAVPSQKKIFLALLPAAIKREHPGKNKTRAGIQGSFPRMFSNRLQPWNFLGQRLVKLMEEDSKMVRYSHQRYRLSAARSSAVSWCIFLYKCHFFIKLLRCHFEVSL